MKRVTKSVTALLLALVLSLTLLPAQALAADTAPATQTYTGTAYVGAHTNPVYARVWKGIAETSLQTAPSAQTAVAAQAVDYLTETEAVAALRKQMVARKETMTLNVKLPSGTDIEEAVTGIWDKAMEHVSGSGTTGDYLHWQHSGYDCPPVDYWDDDTNITFTVTFQRHPKTSAIWFTTAAQEAALTNYIRNTILPQLSLGGKTTYQKVQAIYNWITANVKYDYSHLNDPAYRLQYTAYAAAVQKKAVCQGYANLFYRLANDAGIDCRIITGKAYNRDGAADHAWNIVRMADGKYYCLDATWDAGSSPAEYQYFLKGLTNFSRDHQAETDKLNTPYWTQYESRTSDTDYKASSTQLPAPTVTGGNDSQGRPTLKWNAVTGAAKYEVYRARSKDGDYIKYATATGTSYTNTSYIENGSTYYYKVRALDANGTAGAWSSIVSVTYKQTLSAPTVTGGNDAQGRPTLTWKAVTGAAKYEVYRARSKDGDYIKYSTVTGTSYTNTSYIENGNTYYYKVRALKSDGTAGAWSSIVAVTYKQTLSAPAVTGGNDSQGRPTLKWNAVTGAAKYEVYRARSKDGDYIKYSTVTGTSYTNTSYIENGNTYYYKVRALKSDGTAGAWSSIVSVTYRKPAAATVASGKCGDSAKWKLDAEGTLTISGTGRMYDYEWPADRGGTTPPWLANKYRDSIRALRVEQGITYIGRCAFDSCGNLSDVTLPTSLRIIGPWAFNDCTALRSIQLPEGLTTIKEDAFKAAGLVSITFPSTLRELRNCAFMNCEKLQSLRLPEGLTTIGVWAFYCNPNISSIYIPASVTTIGEEAFIYYNNLATVRYGGSQSQWSAVSVGANAFPDGVRYVYNVN